MHAYFVQRFVESRGFGDERMVNLNNPRFRNVYADGMRYAVGRVQLLSLNGGNAPFAYVTAVDADKEQIKHAAHEPVGNAEIDAIAKLKDGMTVVLTVNEGHREMIGAIRATASCTQCHDCPKAPPRRVQIPTAARTHPANRPPHGAAPKTLSSAKPRTSASVGWIHHDLIERSFLLLRRVCFQV